MVESMTLESSSLILNHLVAWFSYPTTMNTCIGERPCYLQEPEEVAESLKPLSVCGALEAYNKGVGQ